MLQHASLKKMLTAASNVNPWVWVAFVYGLQALGSMVLIRLLKLPSKDVVLPMLLLLLGTTMASLIGMRAKKCGTGKWSCWLPAIIYALFIFSLSHRSFSASSVSLPSDYFHPVEYATFGIFLCFVWHPLIERRGTAVFASIVFLSGFLYGIFDEVHQSFIPGRNSSLFDLLLDALGLSIGCAVFLTAREVLRRVGSGNGLEASADVSGEKNV